MREKIIIVDNFYDNPSHYSINLSHSLKNKIKYNKCQTETIGKISQILSKNLELVHYNFEVISKKNTNDKIYCHLESDWNALIYLTLPIHSFGEFGVKFFLDNENNDKKILGTTQIKNKQYTEYGCIPAKYNRLILFDSSMWFSFGSSVENDILYENIILKQK